MRAQLKLLTAMKNNFRARKRISLVAGSAALPHVHNRESHIWTQFQKDA